jgi:hypothetical protein
MPPAVPVFRRRWVHRSHGDSGRIIVTPGRPGISDTFGPGPGAWFRERNGGDRELRAGIQGVAGPRVVL